MKKTNQRIPKIAWRDMACRLCIRPVPRESAGGATVGVGGGPCLVAAATLVVALVGLASARALAQNAPKEEPWKAPARAARKVNPIAPDAKTIAQGKDLFVMACLPCHGPTGRGDGPAAATLERNGARVRPGNLSLPQMWQQSDGELFWKISEGRTPMPTWKDSLNEEQRWLIVNYVRTLAPPGTYTNESITTQASVK
jgi:mono/diheme cytochrome c family protein